MASNAGDFVARYAALDTGTRQAWLERQDPKVLRRLAVELATQLPGAANAAPAWAGLAQALSSAKHGGQSAKMIVDMLAADRATPAEVIDRLPPEHTTLVDSLLGRIELSVGHDPMQLNRTRFAQQLSLAVLDSMPERSGPARKRKEAVRDAIGAWSDVVTKSRTERSGTEVATIAAATREINEHLTRRVLSQIRKPERAGTDRGI